jgi:hypothetical protein
MNPQGIRLCGFSSACPPWSATGERRNMFSRNDQARSEKKQDRMDSGLLSKHFPEVAGIVVTMMYTQRGGITVDRVVNFYPSSYAFFRMDCLSQDCVNGGFDLSHTIHMMVRHHSEASTGELACDDDGPRPGHSNIVYKIAIRYA